MVRESLPLRYDRRNFQLDFEIVANQESSGFTFVIIMWRATNCAVECAGSIL